MPSPPTTGGGIGYLVGFDNKEGASVCTLDDAPQLALLNAPLFDPYNRNNIQWWYNLVEEAAFSNVNYIALGSRGNSACPADNPPVGDEPPSLAVNVVTALNQRGYSSILKVAFMDDTGAYPGHLKVCQGIQPFDLGNTSLWATYIWNNNWLPYFRSVPEPNRLKIQGRPVVFMWSVATGLGYTNQQGHLAGLISYLRNQCLSQLGFNPFIIVDQSWPQLDTALGSAPDGVDNWFSVPGPSWSLRTFAGNSGSFTTGVAVPGFWVPGASMFIDRLGGQTLRAGLANTAGAGIVLLEGLSNSSENAAYYRGSSTCEPACGKPYTYPSGQCWSTPNQYLNIVRETTAPFPRFIVYEAEAADSYSSFNLTGSGLYRRGDRLNIQYTDSSQSQWSVAMNAGEWLEFSSFQLGASSSYRLGIRYASAGGATGRLLIDGSALSSFTLPASASFVTLTVPGGFSISASHHNVRFQLDTGDLRLDQWILNGL